MGVWHYCQTWPTLMHWTRTKKSALDSFHVHCSVTFVVFTHSNCTLVDCELGRFSFVLVYYLFASWFALKIIVREVFLFISLQIWYRHVSTRKFVFFVIYWSIFWYVHGSLKRISVWGFLIKNGFCQWWVSFKWNDKRRFCGDHDKVQQISGLSSHRKTVQYKSKLDFFSNGPPCIFKVTANPYWRPLFASW